VLLPIHRQRYLLARTIRHGVLSTLSYLWPSMVANTAVRVPRSVSRRLLNQIAPNLGASAAVIDRTDTAVRPSRLLPEKFSTRGLLESNC
jgi:hypothetical protein